MNSYLKLKVDLLGVCVTDKERKEELGLEPVVTGVHDWGVQCTEYQADAPADELGYVQSTTTGFQVHCENTRVGVMRVKRLLKERVALFLLQDQHALMDELEECLKGLDRNELH